MLKINFRWKGKCPKHPRYDPSKLGGAGRAASCPQCEQLYSVYAMHRSAVATARQMEIEAERETSAQDGMGLTHA